MSACYVTGLAQGGVKILSCPVSDAVSQGDTCDRLRQAEGLETLLLRCELDPSLVEGNRDQEIEALQAFIEAPWVLLQAVLAIPSCAQLRVVLELPQPTTELMQSIGSFWSCWLESKNLAADATQGKVELRFLSETRAGES
ncbi:MAG: hypothetical protein P8O91_02695 [Luminiphilus sp.]|nr:hypothetical protein [Luminiphilus sp.]